MFTAAGCPVLCRYCADPRNPRKFEQPPGGARSAGAVSPYHALMAWVASSDADVGMGSVCPEFVWLFRMCLLFQGGLAFRHQAVSRALLPVMPALAAAL